MEQANYGDNGNYATAYCQDPSGDICLHWHVEINNYPYGESPGPPNYSLAHRKFVSCQELGHTAGLHHHQNNNTSDPSCMYNSHSLHNPNLNTHDYNHITDILT